MQTTTPAAAATNSKPLVLGEIQAAGDSTGRRRPIISKNGLIRCGCAQALDRIDDELTEKAFELLLGLFIAHLHRQVGVFVTDVHFLLVPARLQKSDGWVEGEIWLKQDVLFCVRPRKAQGLTVKLVFKNKLFDFALRDVEQLGELGETFSALPLVIDGFTASQVPPLGLVACTEVSTRHDWHQCVTVRSNAAIDVKQQIFRCVRDMRDGACVVLGWLDQSGEQLVRGDARVALY